MKNLIYTILLCALLSSLNSCEWFNTKILGKPSRAQIAYRIKLEKARNDSIAQAELARLAEIARQEEEAKQKEAEAAAAAEESLMQRYHVIFGCFKVPSNAERMRELLQSDGYTPVTLSFYNGFTCISIQSFDSLHGAFNAMRHFLSNVSYCPEDVWVYDSTFGLHHYP